MDKTSMWLVMRMMNWDSFSVESTNVPLAFKFLPPDGADQPIGFLPIFDTLEKAESWSEGRYDIFHIAQEVQD